MAVYRLLCTACGHRQRVLASRPPAEPKCEDCGGDCRRAPPATGVSAVEHLDNGLMVRPVERPVEIERLRREAIDTVEKDAYDEYQSVTLTRGRSSGPSAD